MNRLISVGITQLARGARRRNPAMTAFGAAALAVGLLRRFRRPTKELLYAAKLRPGATVRIRMLPSGDLGEVEES